MEAQAGIGMWELLIFWIFTGSGLMGLPPGERDLALLKSVPPQTLVYFEWASRGQGMAGAPGIDGFAADPEIRQLFEKLDVAFSRTDVAGSDQIRELQSEMRQLVKRLTAVPGCVFVGFEPAPANKPGLALWLAILNGMHGGAIFSTGNETDDLWAKFNRVLTATPGFTFDGSSMTQVIPVAIPGYKLVMHREGSRIIFAFGEGTLPRILDGLSGQLPGLEANQRFRQSIERVAVPRVSTVGWVDGRGIVDAVMAGLGPLGALVRPVLTMVRFDAVDHVVLIAGVNREVMVKRTFVGTGGITNGVMVLFSGQPIQAYQFAHVPADADLVVAASVSLKGIFQEARNLLATARPLAVRVFDEAVKEFETEIGLNIVDGVLPAFGDVITAFDSPAAGGMIATSLVVSLEVRDAQKAQSVFDHLMKLIEQSIVSGHANALPHESISIRQQQFLGYTVFYLNSTGSGRPMTPTFCLTEKHLLFSIHPQAMKSQLKFLQSNGPGFDRQFADRVNPPAGEVLSYAYLNGPRAYGVLGSVMPYLGHAIIGQLEAHGLAIDSFSIPTASAFSSYFGDSTALLIRLPDGLLIESQNAPPITAAIAGITAYEAWHRSQPDWNVDAPRNLSDGGDGVQLGPVTSDGSPVDADAKPPVATVSKGNPSPYRKLAPLFLKALIPDDVQQMIPESAFRQLEDGPSAATIERREEARKKREERRRRKQKVAP